MRRHIPKEVKDIALFMSFRHRLPDKEIRKYTGISIRALKRLRQTYLQTGETVRVPVCIGRPRQLDALDANFLEGCIERQPDLTLEELQTYLLEVCNVKASTMTIWRTLKRRGFSRKMVTRPAVERNERDRMAYKMLIGEHFQPHHLVFADETHFNRITLRRRFGWAPLGHRARRRDFFVRGKRYSILPAISLDGVIHLTVQDHSYTGEEFADFVQGVLGQMQPWPLPNSVLVMDNASIHRVPEIREMVEARLIQYRGMRLVYLPGYSPDLNPIEEAFSALKSWLRSNRDYVLGEIEGVVSDPYALIWEAVHTVMTPESAYGWYQHSEYIA
ncbi:hypothetical protein TRAPUB_12796 [Trametes pubescens]|uniref:Tc1-like transposase DDE domain-containing protein n=1 Tax=Trametes pubescens TaxID=154538 RepID=A0A1M2VSX5_TRAPU|nr:hypothetical protein TRAPUB_12796 [Trametes pubescens]